MEITTVTTEADADDVRRLILEFVDWQHERYPDLRAYIDAYFNGQGFDAEMANITQAFGPPHGTCLLAHLNGEPAGIVMMKPRKIGEIAEMNRMFVRKSARGHGIGKALVQRLISDARAMSYTKMELETLDNHDEALGLYVRLGFFDEPERPLKPGASQRQCRLALDLSA